MKTKKLSLFPNSDYMRNLILVLFLFLGKLTLLAHDVTLRDSVTNAPIFCATVCDADGNYVGRSDVNGNINLKKGCAYHVSHICYESKKFICDDNTSVVMSPKSYTMPDLVVTAKMKKYYRCKVFFRNVQYVDSCMKYYVDGVRELFIDTKKRKVKSGNAVFRRFQTMNNDIRQKKKRVVMMEIAPGLAWMERQSMYEKIMMDEIKRIVGDIVYGDSVPIGRCEVYPDKKEIVLSCDQLYPKPYKKWNLFGYHCLRTEDKCTEVYDADGTVPPTIFDLKSSNRCRHITFSLKKDFVWDYDCEDTFYVVEREYTDTMEPTSYEVMKQDYDKYYAMYPADEKTKSQLAEMKEVDYFKDF